MRTVRNMSDAALAAVALTPAHHLPLAAGTHRSALPVFLQAFRFRGAVCEGCEIYYTILATDHVNSVFIKTRARTTSAFGLMKHFKLACK